MKAGGIESVCAGIWEVPLNANPVMGEAVEAVQVKVVPVTVAVRFTAALVCPEQIVCSSGQLVTVGLGFTVMACVVEFPGHPWKAEVMVYVTVCCMLVTFSSVTGVIGFAMPGAMGHGLTLPTGQAADQE